MTASQTSSLYTRRLEGKAAEGPSDQPSPTQPTATPGTIAHSGLPRLAALGGQEALFTKGEGCRVFDDHGTAYVDFVLGYGSVVLGHALPEFQRLLEKYSGRGLMLPGYSTLHVSYLSRLLHGRCADHSAAFFKTGSESVTAAIRLATYRTKRKAVLRCGFIGWHDAELGGSLRWHEHIDSPLRYVPRFATGFRGVSGDELVLNWSTLRLDDLRSLLHSHEDRIGCFVVDTYQARFVEREVLREAIALCNRAGIVVVADETKIAGRVSTLGFAIDDSWGADLYIVGKALGNGAPISILFGSPSLMSASEDARVTGTFSQETSAIAAALVTMDYFSASDGYVRLRSIGQRVVHHFNRAAVEAQVSLRVRAEALFGGSMFDLAFSSDLLGDWHRRQGLCHVLAGEGVLLLQGHPSYVCLAHESCDYDDLEQRFRAGLVTWKRQQCL